MVDRWLSTVLAVLGTVLVVLVFLAVFGEDASSPGSAVTTEGAAASPGRSSATRSPSASSGGSRTPGRGSTTAPSRLRAPMVVLNQAGVSGLASRTEKRIEAGGWRVTAIGDFTGTVPTNTVYFPSGFAEQARAFTRQFPQIATRTRQAFSNLRGDRLTLILAKDWQ